MTRPPAGRGAGQPARREALNRSGVFLHIAAIQAIKSSGCLCLTEMPVRIAPFVSDPMMQRGVASRRGGYDGPQLLNRTMLTTAIAGSQDALQGKQRTIDIIEASHKPPIGRRSGADRAPIGHGGSTFFD